MGIATAAVGARRGRRGDKIDLGEGPAETIGRDTQPGRRGEGDGARATTRRSLEAAQAGHVPEVGLDGREERHVQAQSGTTPSQALEAVKAEQSRVCGRVHSHVAMPGRKTREKGQEDGLNEFTGIHCQWQFRRRTVMTVRPCVQFLSLSQVSDKLATTIKTEKRLSKCEKTFLGAPTDSSPAAGSGPDMADQFFILGAPKPITALNQTPKLHSIIYPCPSRPE